MSISFIQEKSFCLAVIFQDRPFFPSDCFLVTWVNFFFVTPLSSSSFICLFKSTKVFVNRIIIYRKRGGQRGISAS